MALIQCPDCKEAVSDSAPACPKCGRPMPDAKPPKRKFGWKHWAVLALAVLALLSLLRARHPGVAPSASGATGVQAAAEDKVTAKLKKRLEKQLAEAKDGGVHASATSVQIYNEYQANEVSADSKYRDKWVRVTGKLQSVAKDITDDPYLVLAADPYGVGAVHAVLFDAQIKGVVENRYEAGTAMDKAATLKPGQRVTVECLGKGSVIGMPRLEQCVIVPEQGK